jgi:hypothetical protein
MKKLLLIAVLVISAKCLQAQNDKYFAAMVKNIAAIDTSFKNPANLISLANTFERIGLAEKKQWLPFYYAALMQINYVFVNPDKSNADALADKAEMLINKADSLSPDNSEISTVRSMIATGRMTVDPQSRYMKFAQLINSEMEKAMKQDPANPRPYYLKGQNLKYTPEQFGGGCKNATEVLEQAAARFEVFKPASELHPNWGKNRNLAILAECKK